MIKVYRFATGLIILGGFPAFSSPCLPEIGNMDQAIPHEIHFDNFPIKIESQFAESDRQDRPHVFRYCVASAHIYSDIFFNWDLGAIGYYEAKIHPGQTLSPHKYSSYKNRIDPGDKIIEMGLSKLYSESFKVETVLRSAHLTDHKIYNVQATSDFQAYSIEEILSNPDLLKNFIEYKSGTGDPGSLPLYATASITLPTDNELATAYLNGESIGEVRHVADLEFYVRSELIFESGAIEYSLGAVTNDWQGNELRAIESILDDIQLSITHAPMGTAVVQKGIRSLSDGGVAETYYQPIVIGDNGVVELVNSQVNATYNGNTFLSFPVELMVMGEVNG